MTMEKLNRRQFLGAAFAACCIPAIGKDSQSEFDKCKNDILYFVDNYLEVDDPVYGKLKMSHQQQEYLQRISTAPDYFFCAKGRQIGISTANNVFAYWKTTFFENQHVFIVEPSVRMVDAVCHMPRVSSSSFKMNDGCGIHVITPNIMMAHDLTDKNHTYILDEFDFWDDEHSLDRLSQSHLNRFLANPLFAKELSPEQFGKFQSHMIVPSSICSFDNTFVTLLRNVDDSRRLVLPSPTTGLKA